MLFILTSKYSHIIDIIGRSEGIKKTMMASKTAEEAMGLKGYEGKTTYMLKEIGSREWVNNMQQLWTVYLSQYLVRTHKTLVRHVLEYRS